MSRAELQAYWNGFQQGKTGYINDVQRKRAAFVRYIGFALLGVELGTVIGLLVADSPMTLISIGGVLLLAAYFLALLAVDR